METHTNEPKEVTTIDEEKREVNLDSVIKKMKSHPRETKADRDKKKADHYGLPEDDILEKIKLEDAVGKIRWPCNVMIVGRTYSGKTSLIKNLIDKRKFNNIWLISLTAGKSIDADWHNMIDHDFIFNNINNEIIDFIYDFQEKNPRSRQLIIFDDFIDSERTLHKIPKLMQLCTSGRHDRISTCISTQSLAQVPATIRKQQLAVFAGKQYMDSAEAFGREFANTQLPTKELKNRIMDIGKRHDWLMLDAREAYWSILPQEEIDIHKYSAKKAPRAYFRKN